LEVLSRGTPRYAVAGGILFSEEHLGKVVDGLYLSIFGRHVDPTGRAYWVGQLQRGMPIQVLVALSSAPASSSST
jgi:hypothetical protein